MVGYESGKVEGHCTKPKSSDRLCVLQGKALQLNDSEMSNAKLGSINDCDSVSFTDNYE